MGIRYPSTITEVDELGEVHGEIIQPAPGPAMSPILRATSPIDGNPKLPADSSNTKASRRTDSRSCAEQAA